MQEAQSRGEYHGGLYAPLRQRFTTVNPGFSESSYKLAIHAANVALR
ncbi:hypothetical protein [Dyella sp. 20L07]